MAEASSGSRKRSFVEDDDSNKPPSEKRARFPKGKKVKQGENVSILSGEEIIHDPKNPRLVATKLAHRRNNFTTQLLRDEGSEFVPDVRKVEVQYQEEESFVEEGVKIEPFNLDKEREEGYFDENENYVEYVNRNDIKDAWLDSVDADKKYTGMSSHPPSTNETPRDLVTEDLAKINRRIANVLEPGETVLRALRRLKGSSDKKHKMSAETKQLFDQLTEDAMKLMENGDYNVYEEKQEHFKREAEGYEKIINARKGGVLESSLPGKSDNDFDMFADDDGIAAAGDVTTNEIESANIQPSNSGDLLNDYVYDESSGYYYSNSSGYYYDPSSGFYFSATSGKWYCYNQESETYEEVPQDTGANMAEL